MSQAGLIDIESSHPQIPTQFDTDSGNAVPIANVLEVLGSTVANGTNAQPTFTTGSGNTVTVEVQVGTAVVGAPADTNDAGLVSFDSTEFSVDANGFVQLLGGGEAIDSNTGDDGVEVSSDLLGNFNWIGQTVANATHVKPVYFKDSATANAIDLDIQVGAAITGAPGDKLDAGLVSFDSTEFTVDANGFVQLLGGGEAIDSNTGDDGVEVSSDLLGNFNWLGQTVANATHAKPVYFKDSATANALDLDVQVAAAVTGAPGDKLDAGLSSYNDVFHTVDADGYVDLTTNWEATSMHGWNGCIIETADIGVTSDGATITFSVEQSGGGNLTVVFSDGYYAWTTAPDTIALTPGTDAVPVLNYVYFLQSTKTLTASTAGWPATEHAPLATVYCQSAASLAGDLAMKDHAWTDHVTKTNGQGHISDINFWIRQQQATWISGVTQTYTITANGGAADNVILTTTAGVILQLHSQTMPAFAGTPTLYVVNDSVTANTKVTDLNTLLTDSAGGSMSGRYFSLVIWGSVSEDTGECKLFVNLPGGSYNNSTGVLDDVDAFSNYTIPAAYRGTGFLISEWKLRHQAAASGTWTSLDEINLLGLFPSLSAGGTPGSIAFTTDSGVATPASNNLNVLGGTGINTAGATDTLTVNLDIPVLAIHGGTGQTVYATGDILYADSTTTLNQLVAGSNTDVLTLAGGVPTWAAPTDLHDTRFIVSAGGTADGANYTTIASAITAAVTATGVQDIFIQPGVYTEDLTLPENINLVAHGADGYTPTVTIDGKITATSAGSRSISGIRLQTNSDFCLAVTGSAATKVYLKDCYVLCADNTGISYTSSSSSSVIEIIDSILNIDTTGIAHFSVSSTGNILLFNCQTKNNGASTTSSTISSGTLTIRHCAGNPIITTSGTATIQASYSVMAPGGLNTIALTHGSTGSNCLVEHCEISSGTASAISVGTGATLEVTACKIKSKNTNPITGLGTVNYTGVFFTDTGVDINTTTRTSGITRPGITRSEHQPAFLSVSTVAQNNVTGDGTAFTVGFATEIFDQHGDVSGSILTAPYDGRYQLSSTVTVVDLAAGHTDGQLNIITSNRTYLGSLSSPAACMSSGNSFSMTCGSLADMDIADTALVSLTVSNSTKTVDVNNSGANTTFSGHLVC